MKGLKTKTASLTSATRSDSRQRPTRPGEWPGRSSTRKPAIVSPSDTVPATSSGPPSIRFTVPGASARTSGFRTFE